MLLLPLAFVPIPDHPVLIVTAASLMSDGNVGETTGSFSSGLCGHASAA